VTEAYRALRKEVIGHGIEVDAVAGVLEAWRRTGVELDARTVAPIVDEMMRALVPSSTLLPGVGKLLSELRTWNLPIGVVSSAVHHSFLEWSLDYHGVRDVFTDVLSSAAAGYYKSRPEIYRIAFDRLGADASCSVHIGDSFTFDHLTAGAVGAQTIWLNPKGDQRPAGKPGPTAEVTTMADVEAHLSALLHTAVDLFNHAD
jgi:FMN phosphatase YigB (HAD superfamily)